ncbi:MAG: hypothetical protein RR975_11045, partial [Clostridia bacterium]
MASMHQTLLHYQGKKQVRDWQPATSFAGLVARAAFPPAGLAARAHTCGGGNPRCISPAGGEGCGNGFPRDWRGD